MNTGRANELRVVTSFHANGMPFRREVVRKTDNGDVRDGVLLEWYDSGSLRVVAEYANGEESGLYLVLAPNGQVAAELHMRVGSLAGRAIYFNPDGSCFSLGKFPGNPPKEFTFILPPRV